LNIYLAFEKRTICCSTHSGKCGIVFQDESKFNNNDKKIIQKLGMDGKPGPRLLTYAGKEWRFGKLRKL
jgi:heterodisulfide reductase subunit B